MIKRLIKKILRRPYHRFMERLEFVTLETNKQLFEQYTNMLERKIGKLEYKIERLDYKVEMQQDITALNFLAFDDYKNIHTGRDIVIVGAGPTLKYYQPIEEAIHIGVNNVYKDERLKLDYFFATDFRSHEAGFIKEIDKINCIKFLGRMDRYVVKTDGIATTALLERAGATGFYVDKSPSKHIFLDIRYHPLMNFRSVIFPAIHFALFTNPKRLFLVGCDSSLLGHFNGDPQLADENYLRKIMHDWLTGYQQVKIFAAREYPETKIISINPVNLRGLFKDDYTEEYCKENELDEGKQQLFSNGIVSDEIITRFVDEHIAERKSDGVDIYIE